MWLICPVLIGKFRVSYTHHAGGVVLGMVRE